MIDLVILRDMRMIGPRIYLAASFLLPMLLMLAATLYPQPESGFVVAGKMIHICSIAAACVVLLIMVHRRWLAVGYILAMLALYIAVRGTPLDGIYIAGLMTLFAMAGLVSDLSAVRTAVFGVFAISLPVMLLQLLGWPDWINGLAMHAIAPDGTDWSQPAHPTLFVPATELSAQSAQIRPAGVFSSNQYNTLFLFAVFALALTSDRWRWLLVAAAAGVVLSMSKSAIVGTVVVAVIVAAVHRGDYGHRALVYAMAVAAGLVVYEAVFPGVFRYTLVFSTFFNSFAVRALDIGEALALDGLVRTIFLIPDTIAVPVDSSVHDSALSLYAQIADEPLIAGVIAALMAVAALAIYYSRGRNRIGRPTPFALAMLVCCVCFTAVADVSTWQSFWFFVGMGGRWLLAPATGVSPSGLEDHAGVVRS